MKLKKEIVVGINQSSIGTEYGGIVYLLTTDFNGTVSFYFEIIATNADTVARNVWLSNSPSLGTEAIISVPAGTTTPTRFRSSAYTPDNGSPTKRLALGTTTVEGQLSISVAKIIVIQNVNGNLTKTESQVGVGGIHSGSSLTQEIIPGPLWYYDSANWGGATKTFQAEAVYYNSSSKLGTTVKLQEDDGNQSGWLDKATVVNAGTSSFLTRVRVTFTPTHGRNYRFVVYGNSTKYTYYLKCPVIIIRQVDTTRISKTEGYFFTCNNTTDTGILKSEFRYLHDPNEWELTGVEINNYAEHGGPASNSNSKLQQKDNGSWSDISNSNITGAGRVRGTTALSVPSSAKEIACYIVTAGGTFYGQRVVYTIATDTYAYSGNIPLTLTPASQAQYESPSGETGNVTVSLTPASTHLADYPNYTGTVQISLTPASTYEHAFYCEGNISLSLTPGAIYFADFSYLGAILAQLIPNSTYAFNEYLYNGNISLTVVPASQYSYARILGLAERGDFVIREVGGYGMAISESGEVALLGNPITESGRFLYRDRPNLSKWDFVGAISFNIIPNSLHFANFIYNGSIGLSLTPNSSYAPAFPPYEGAVTFNLTPNSSYDYGFFWTGAIGLNLSPSSLSFVDYLHSGAILVSLLPQSDYYYGVEAVYFGDVQLTLTPEATCGPEWPYVGNIFIEVIPASTYFRDFIYQANVPLEIIPYPSYFFVPIYFYTGDVTLSLLPASNHFGDYIYYGELLTSLQPNSSYFADYVFLANQFLNLFPQSTFAPQWEVVGEIDLTLFPGAGYKHDFYFPGSILIRLLPESTHLAHYLYFGLIQILLGLSNLDAQEPIESFFFDSIESRSMPPAPQGIYPYPVIETKTLPPPTETVIYIETEERVK